MPLGATIEKYPARARIHVLKGEGDAGRGEPQPRHQGRELAREVEYEHERHGCQHDDIAGHENKASTVGIVHVVHRGHAP